MPQNSKKYLITNETHEIFILRRGKNAYSEYCAKCEKTVAMLNLDAATIETGIRTTEVFYLLESGEIHSIETNSGQLLICKDSLLRVHKNETNL
jgi:hypothetical protein